MKNSKKNTSVKAGNQGKARSKKKKEENQLSPKKVYELKSKLKKTESQLKKFQNIIQFPEQVDNNFLEDDSIHKFIIWYRQSKKQFHGQIFKISGSEKCKGQPLSGVGQEQIIEYIVSHLEREQDQAIDQPKIKPDLEHKKDETAPIDEISKIPRLSCELVILSDLSSTPRKIVHKGLPFEVGIKLDLSEDESLSDQPLKQSVSVFAKPMDKNSHILVGMIENEIVPPKEITASFNADPLPVGNYRLEALVKHEHLDNEKGDDLDELSVAGSLFKVL